MKDTNILIRIDQATKEKATQVAQSYGLSLSAVVYSYLADIAQKGKIPLNLASHAHRLRSNPGVLSLPYIARVVEAVGLSYSAQDIKAIYLFGSYARGEAKQESDVDLLVVGGEGLSYFTLGELNETLRQKLHRSVDTTLASSLPAELIDQVNKDKILLYENR